MAFSGFGTLVAQYNSSLPTLTSGNFTTLQTDINGQLLVKVNAALPTGSNTIGAISNLFALDATLAKLTIAQGAALGSNTQALTGGSVTTAAPTYTTGQISPLSLDTAGNLRVTLAAGTTEATSWLTQATTTGTITTSSSAITSSSVSGYSTFLVTVSGTYAGVNFNFQASDDAGVTYYLVQAVRLDSFVAETTSGVLPSNQSRAWLVSAPGATNFQIKATAFTSGTANIRISPTASPADQAITVGGTVAATQSGTWTVQPGNTANTTPWLATINQGGNSATVSAGGALKVDGSAVTQPVSYASGTFVVSDAALELAQASTTSGQKGILIQGAVTTAAPTYTTAQTDPLSLTTAGAVRADINSIASTTVLTGNGTTGAGSQRVTIASDNTAFAVNAVQSGTWTVQPGNTANTTPWLSTINQGGNSATVTAGNALKVDGSAVTQPVSIAGTVPVDKLWENGTYADTSSASGTGTPVAIVTGSMTDVVTLAVGAGVTAYTVGLTASADTAAQFEFVEYNGTTVITWYRSFIVSASNPTVYMTFPIAIKKVGASTHAIKIRAQALQANGNAMAAINAYTR